MSLTICWGGPRDGDFTANDPAHTTEFDYHADFVTFPGHVRRQMYRWNPEELRYEWREWMRPSLTSMGREPRTDTNAAWYENLQRLLHDLRDGADDE